jgi:tRNA(fMet)-specific endonuclease VapC
LDDPKALERKTHAAFEQRLKACVIVPYDLDLCKTYGKLRAALLDKGQPIAASAVRHSIPLITHNAKHFVSIRNLKVITESAKQPSPITGP